MPSKSKAKVDHGAVYVITAKSLKSGTAERITVGQGDKQLRGMLGEGKQEDLVRQWGGMLGDVATMLSEGARKVSDQWQLSEIRVDLAVDAKGKLAFIAEASAKATVSVTLRRKAP